MTEHTERQEAGTWTALHEAAKFYDTGCHDAYHVEKDEHGEWVMGPNNNCPYCRGEELPAAAALREVREALEGLLDELLTEHMMAGDCSEAMGCRRCGAEENARRALALLPAQEGTE